MYKLSKLDEIIIQQLHKNAMQSTTQLAKKLKINPQTCRRRLRNLKKAGIVKFALVVDTEKLTSPLNAVITLDVDTRKVDSIISILAAQDEVVWIAGITGRFDIFALCQFLSIDDLQTFLRNVIANIEGLRNTETFICVNTKKGLYMRV